MPVKEHPSFILNLCGEGTEKSRLYWQKGKEEEIVGAVFIAVNCQCGIKDQLDS